VEPVLPRIDVAHRPFAHRMFGPRAKR
jgi:hypothetical protein